MSSSGWTGCWTSRGRGKGRKITDAQVDAVIINTLESAQRDATHWSTRSMAKEVGLTRPRCGGCGGRSGCNRIGRRRGSSGRVAGAHGRWSGTGAHVAGARCAPRSWRGKPGAAGRAARPSRRAVHENVEREAFTGGAFTEPLERILRAGAGDGLLRSSEDPADTATILFSRVGGPISTYGRGIAGPPTGTPGNPGARAARDYLGQSRGLRPDARSRVGRPEPSRA